MQEALLQFPQQVAFVPADQLVTMLRSVFREEIRAKQNEALQERLLSPKETCKLFEPNISLVTLDSWADKGLLTKHHIGGRTYYKYSEIMASLKTIRKYSRR